LRLYRNETWTKTGTGNTEEDDEEWLADPAFPHHMGYVSA